MHDGVDPTTITTGDTWMFNHLDSLRRWAITNNTLYIITFDESYDSDPNNQILTLFYGPMVKGGMYSENVNLYNLLRTIEDLYSIPTHAGSAASATAITDCWLHASTGVNNSAENAYSFQVIPNPASSMINLKSNQPLSEPATVQITDLTGRTVGKYTMNGTDLTVNISELGAGVYFYKVLNNDSTLGKGKFVISHK
jgi:phosphatidylinositol-3-phosphatase